MIYSLEMRKMGKMKVTQKHYDVIREGMEKVLRDYPDMETEYRDEGHGPRKYRWDVFYIASLRNYLPKDYLNTVLYKYLNDHHIDTALFKILGVSRSAWGTKYYPGFDVYRKLKEEARAALANPSVE